MAAGLVSFLIAAWLIVSISSPASAYLDPVTGSFLIQGAIASAVAVLAAIRSVRERVMTLFGLRKPDVPTEKIGEQLNVPPKPAAHDASH